MQYQVPQFIEVEDKIFGPLTARQFIYLAGSGGVALALFSTLPFIVAIILGVPIVAFGIALSFYKVNGRPFLLVLENAFNYYIGKKLYLWNSKRQFKSAGPSEAQLKQEQSGSLVPKLSESKLQNLSWSLNIKDRQLMGVRPDEEGGLASEFKI